MADGNGNVQIDNNKGNNVPGEIKKFDEKKPFPEGIFGGDGIKKLLKEPEEKKQGNLAPANIEEIVSYLRNITAFSNAETKILHGLVKKCFSANRSDLIKKIDEKHMGTNVEYIYTAGNGSTETKNTPYKNYILKVLNELIDEKAIDPEIKNIFNAVNAYDTEIITKLADNTAGVLYKMHLETEEGRVFIKKCNTALARKFLNNYYLEIVENMDVNEIIVEKKE